MNGEVRERLTALDKFLRSEFGGRFTVDVETVTIGTALTKAVDNDFERMGITFINTGANDIHLTPDRSASSSIGVLLGANGGFLSLTARDDLVLVGWTWFGVSKTASSDLLIFSVKRYHE